MNNLDPIELRDPERLDLPSASAMEIVVKCPGMPNLKRSLPAVEKLEDIGDAEDKEWAERGTRIHLAFETGNTLELNPEEHATYTTGVNYLEQIKQKWISDLGLDPEKVVEGKRELRVFLTKPYDFPNLMGSAMTDRHFIYRNGDRCCVLVADLKSGWNPNLPPSAHSWQLKYQLVTLWTEYDGVTEGRVAYVKAKDKVERGDYCDYQAMDLKYAFDSIAFHSWESSQPDAPRHAGPHCRWCSNKAHCPEALAYALLPSTMIKGVFSRKKPTEQVQQVSLDDLYRLWEGGSTIRSILDAVTARLKAMSDEELQQLALTHGPGRKSIQWDVKGAFEFLRDKKLWPESELWKCVDLGLTKLGVLAQKELGVDEKYATDSVKELLSAFITEVEGEKVLRKLR